MKRILLTLMAIASLSLANAHAKIGWTYEQCVAHWGHESDHIILQKPDNVDDPNSKYRDVPLFIFKRGRHYRHHYVEVQFSVIDGWFSYETGKVIKETPCDYAGF